MVISRHKASLEKSMKKPINQKLIKALKFIVLFNILSIPLYLFMAFGISIYPLQVFTANIVHSTLYLIGLDPQMSGMEITVPSPEGGFSGSIDWDCTGWKSILAFIALVFATDESLRKKLCSLAFIPLIYSINIARVVFVFWFVSANGMELYNVVHYFMFGLFMIAVILSMWTLWLKHFKIDETKKRVKKRK